MTAARHPRRFIYAPDTDLAFPASPRPLGEGSGVREEPPAALAEPIYVGAVTAGQRGAFGPISLELMLGNEQIELGPFALPLREARRLARLLEVAVSAFAEVQPPVPVVRRRADDLWRKDLARNARGVAAAGCPWEGETLP